MFIFNIPGEPVPRRERIAGRHMYDVRAAEKRRIKWCLKSQFDQPLLKCALKVTFAFYLGIPESTTRARKAAMLFGRLRPTKKPDASNLIKLYEDCMTGLVYEDDRYIVSISAEKFWAARPCTVITVSQIEENND